MGYLNMKKPNVVQKLSLADIQAKIENAQYINPTGTLTIAILTLSNGYTVTGESACLNPADFDADIGKKIAYENAEEKIWMLEGYLRKEAAFVGAQVILPVVTVLPHDDLVAFIGTKVVNAKSMTRAVYNQFRGWDLPGNENGADEGYLVEYTDAQRPNVEGFKGYVSWSPKDVFEAAYHPFGPTPVVNTEILDEGVVLTNTDAATGPLPFKS